MSIPVPDDRELSGQVDRGAFGELVRDARRSRKLSQAALARAVGVSAVFISQIETGQRIPSDRVVKGIADVLGLPWREVLRSVYTLRSREAGELFAAEESGPYQPASLPISQIPALRLLLMQLAGLDLPQRDIEALVQNWSNEVRFLREQLARVQSQ